MKLLCNDCIIKSSIEIILNWIRMVLKRISPPLWSGHSGPSNQPTIAPLREAHAQAHRWKRAGARHCARIDRAEDRGEARAANDVSQGVWAGDNASSLLALSSDLLVHWLRWAPSSLWLRLGLASTILRIGTPLLRLHLVPLSIRLLHLLGSSSVLCCSSSIIWIHASTLVAGAICSA